MSWSSPRVLVVGCGGIGGTVVSRLLAAGVDVSVLTSNPQVRTALVERGPVFGGQLARGPLSSERVLGETVTDGRSFDFVLLAVPPPEVERAAREVRGVLSSDGRVVCFQNGLCEERVAGVVGQERVVGAVVAWGAQMPEPGCYEQTSAGGFTLGGLGKERDPALDPLGKLLGEVGPVSFTDNLRGARFSKLAINCAVSTLGTLGGARLGALLVRGFVRELALEIMTEAVRVADAEGIRLEPVATTVDLRWLVLPSEGEPSPLGMATKHALLLGVGARYRRLRSSMLSAIERGRAPAVDFLNGEIEDRGIRLGVATPVNARARRMVWELFEKRRLPGVHTLKELRALTREVPRSTAA